MSAQVKRVFAAQANGFEGAWLSLLGELK